MTDVPRPNAAARIARAIDAAIQARASAAAQYKTLAGGIGSMRCVTKGGSTATRRNKTRTDIHARERRPLTSASGRRVLMGLIQDFGHPDPGFGCTGVPEERDQEKYSRVVSRGDQEVEL